MVLDNLDRTQWTFAEALSHVEAVVIAHRAAEASKLPPAPPRESMPWERPQPPEVTWKAEAHEHLLVALRDGDLHAQGRFSDTRSHGTWGPDYRKDWVLHSGHHQFITPAQWRQGQFFKDALSCREWEFIDIRMPRFMVLAIWPTFVPPEAPAEPPVYTTPYLELMQAAIEHFGISDEFQEKKDSIVDWLITKEVAGEPVSKNLADAMATLIRLPASQRGGAKRSWGSDFSRAS